MLDIKEIRSNPALVVDRLLKRGVVFDAKTFSSLDSKRKAAVVRSQSLQAERKVISGKVGKLIKEGYSVDDAKAEVADNLQKLESSLEEANTESSLIQSEIDKFILEIPNLPDDSVPKGSSEENNVEIYRWGEPKTFDFEILDHVALGEGLGDYDSEMASKIAGSRFSVLYDGLARLHRVLIQFMLDKHISDFGYQEIYVPYLVNSDSLYGTGNLPKFEEDLFKIEGDQNFYLIPTAEVPVTNVARDRIFETCDFVNNGIRYVCHTPCSRSEAGSYGRDTRGMIRQHQFDKVELVQLVPAFRGEAALEELTSHAESILQALDLPYRKVLLCGGDMGFSSQKTYDLEVWLPAQQAYREISSCSLFGDFQARRMRARWRNPENGEVELIHTLNGSALAVGRTLVALLENGQKKNGSIAIPRALQPYMRGIDTLTKS
ncbi:MAG: serine--tRNA ligase [Halieaceae bacterium]|nr:serine--tRNA ligase [Halieaceae bacterium]